MRYENHSILLITLRLFPQTAIDFISVTPRYVARFTFPEQKSKTNSSFDHNYINYQRNYLI